ncbi:carotenoid phi-ring synthase-like [Glandiceps talaboti]
MGYPFITAILVLAAQISLSSASPKPPRIINPVNPDDPQKLPPGVTKRVLIAGGGLAGLSAALELAERGYDVTIREALDVFGGRLFTKPVVRLNRTFHVEHGFHGWFHNYHQFKDIRQRLAINHNFQPWGAVDYVFRNYKPEAIYSDGPYPLNLLGIILRSPNLEIGDALRTSLALPDLVWFDHNTIYDKYDNLTLGEWADLKMVDKKFYDIIMRPSLSVTVNEREIISAAEMLMYMQLYFLSDPKADNREVTKQNYYTAVIEPWIKKLRSHGVKLELKSSIKSLIVNETTGMVTGEQSHPKEKYDHVVMATNLIGVHSIMNATLNRYKSNQNISTKLRTIVNKISGLHLAPPYKVFRAWFDRQLTDSPIILETPDFTPVNLIAQYHLLEDEFKNWANETGGSVIEFHLYTWKHGDVPDGKVWSIISPTVKEIYPEIFERQFTMLAYHVNSFCNFPSFERGSHKYRPYSNFAAKSGFPNLALAGDWLHTDYPSALMERSVSTGREAANQILLSDHVRQATMTVTSSYGPGLI